MRARTLTLTLLAYGLLIVLMVLWHVSYGPPYEQPTLGLLVVFACSAAMIGLLSVWLALGALHWVKRLPPFIFGASCLLGGWLLFNEWNQFFLWQIVTMFTAQVASLVILLGLCRLAFGFSIGSGAESERNQSPLSIRDLLMLTASVALLCAVLKMGQPVELGWALYFTLNVAGICASTVVLAALWIVYGKVAWPWRVTVLLFVAPIGGLVYYIADRYMALLFDWKWYSAITSLELVLLVLPLHWFAKAGERDQDPPKEGQLGQQQKTCREPPNSSRGPCHNS